MLNVVEQSDERHVFDLDPIAQGHDGDTPGATFKTPGKYTPQYSGSPAHRLASSSLTTPHRKRAFSAGQIYNPFEHDSINQLHQPMFSPNVFTNNGTSTPRKCENSFKWTIDEQAILFPAEIEDMPHHQEHLHSMIQDDRTERQAQEAIDVFFSSNQIVPSPWTDSERGQSRLIPTPSRGTPAGVLTYSKVLALKNGARDMACQTSLSLPLDFDLERILGAFYRREPAAECEDNNNYDPLSTSQTLRRKLFSQSDKQATSSPLKTSPQPSRLDDDDVKRRSYSPLHSPHLSVHYSTPSTTQFSSSPIHSSSGGGRHSVSPAYQGEFGASSLDGEGAGKQRISGISSRLFAPKMDSGDFGDLCRSDEPVSPLSSPDISPIKFSLNGKGSATKPKVQFRDQRLDADSSYENDNNSQNLSQDAMMDVDTSDTSAPGGAHVTGIGNWGLSTIRESSLMDNNDITNEALNNNDVIADSRDVITSSAHDTGYQTASIQQDASQHTNLTQQMCGLPLDSARDSLPLIDSARDSFEESRHSLGGASSGFSSKNSKENHISLKTGSRAPLRTINQDMVLEML